MMSAQKEIAGLISTSDNTLGARVLSRNQHFFDDVRHEDIPDINNPKKEENNNVMSRYDHKIETSLIQT